MQLYLVSNLMRRPSRSLRRPRPHCHQHLQPVTLSRKVNKLVKPERPLTLYKAVAKQLPANCIPPYKAENSYLPLYYLLLSSSLFTGVMKFIYGRRLINFIYGGVVLC